MPVVMDFTATFDKSTFVTVNTQAPATLEVAGKVPRPTRFDIQALATLPRQELGPTEILCYTGRRVAAVESYAGARLVDVLESCGFSEQPRSELKRCVIDATGDDGYRAIFSWNELYNSATGDKVLVLYEKNAAALDAHLGTLCLISASDTRLGPRHLRGLTRIAVLEL